jgi:hypothetical protein
VLFEPENAPVVKPNAFENTVAVQKAVVEYTDLRLLAGVKFSIDKNSLRPVLAPSDV